MMFTKIYFPLSSVLGLVWCQYLCNMSTTSKTNGILQRMRAQLWVKSSWPPRLLLASVYTRKIGGWILMSSVGCHPIPMCKAYISTGGDRNVLLSHIIIAIYMFRLQAPCSLLLAASSRSIREKKRWIENQFGWAAPFCAHIVGSSQVGWVLSPELHLLPWCAFPREGHRKLCANPGKEAFK